MNLTQTIALRLSSLSVYRGVLEQPVPKALCHLLAAVESAAQSPAAFYEAWGALFSALCREKSEASLSGCLTQAALLDENPYSVACAAGQSVSPLLERAARRDLALLREAGTLLPQDFWTAAGLDGTCDLPEWECGEPVEPLRGELDSCMAQLPAYYRAHGCGIYARYRAFIWRDHAIQPVEFVDPTRLSDLKGYEYPRGLVVDNTRSFLQGLPANNCLLYGDRGTGKSSTVKAVLNEYAGQGLRVIEMPKESLMDFPRLVNRIAGLPMKFLIFIDDLSFSRQDDTYAALKAVLEGGVAARPANALIYATSNRRHLLRETFSDREGDEVHRSDTIQESLSLADRFGLAVAFQQPDKARFLELVCALACERGLEEHLPEIERGAEAWALQRGGRSPRCAKQYIQDYEGRLSLHARGRE